MRQKKLEPYIVINKKKHPWGKPIELSFTGLRMWLSVGYMSQIGVIKDKIAIGKSTIKDVNIFFETKEESGWLYMDEKEARKLKESLDKIFDEDKSGNVKRTYAGHNITKHQRYK